MKKLLLLIGVFPFLAHSQTLTRSNPYISQGYNTNVPAQDFLSMPLGVTGDCKTDDWRALQLALSMHRPVFLPIPPGGCYLISKTLTLQAGDVLYGASANNPNPGDPAAGVVLRLAPGSNVPALKTYTAGTGTGNEYMDVENIVVDGNGSAQTKELQNEALLDFRGTFIGCYLRHIVIINSFGPALFTGDGGGDLRMDIVWIINTSSSTYSWIHNPSKPGFGTLNTDHVFVENQSLPSGGAFRPIVTGDPSTYGHAILLNGVQNGVLKTTHCESALTCVDFRSVQSLVLDGISASRLGYPRDPDPTNQYLVRMLDLNSYQFTMTGAYFDQSGSTFGGSFDQERVFGLAAGLTTNDWYQTIPGKALWPFYTHGEFFSQSGWPYLGERPAVGNELWIQQIGAYSPNGMRIWDNTGAPNGSNAFLLRDGSRLRLGFSPGPWDTQDDTLLQVNWFGPNNPANNIEIGTRLATGTTGNTDFAGELQLSGQSATYSFSGIFSVHPECVITPQFDIGLSNRFWVTYSANSFTINFANPVSGVASYVCVGRN